MSDTSASLLHRLATQATPDDWQRLTQLYRSLIEGWLGRAGLQQADVDDLAQDVMAALVRELPQFRHNGRRGAFRNWLKLIVVHRLQNFWRSRQRRPMALGEDYESMLARLEDPTSNFVQFWDEEHDRHIIRRLLARIEPDFAPTTWRAFRLVVLDNHKEAEAARELNISVNAVFIAKSRVLNRLRKEAQGLVD